MTKEEKQLLLKDLCARLPYGVRVKLNGRRETSNKLTIDWLYTYSRHIEDIKPYLRSMSSMTDEEKKALWEELDKDMGILEENIDKQIIHVYKGRCYRGNPIYHEIDFLNKNYFDWRGLIPMGLALEAPEGMYKTN